ncbi:hypothetical protein OH77DRAFT_1044136 [Trametes cingulata]|nr:hypothetical protein OH77DRAFT_1044136 [Trametes cingulata]
MEEQRIEWAFVLRQFIRRSRRTILRRTPRSATTEALLQAQCGILGLLATGSLLVIFCNPGHMCTSFRRPCRLRGALAGGIPLAIQTCLRYANPPNRNNVESVRETALQILMQSRQY